MRGGYLAAIVNAALQPEYAPGKAGAYPSIVTLPEPVAGQQTLP